MKDIRQLIVICIAVVFSVLFIVLGSMHISDNDVKREEMKQNKDTKRSFNFGFGKKEDG